MSTEKPSPEKAQTAKKANSDALKSEEAEKEVGGFENRPEPTRYGDWEVNGRCSDF